jgi:hypothetical protein
MTADPRDALIAQLQQERDTLRSELQMAYGTITARGEAYDIADRLYQEAETENRQLEQRVIALTLELESEKNLKMQSDPKTSARVGEQPSSAHGDLPQRATGPTERLYHEIACPSLTKRGPCTCTPVIVVDGK